MRRFPYWIAAISLALNAVLLLAAASEKPVRRTINRPGRSIDAPFSDGVLVGDTLYLSGNLGLDPETGRPPKDVAKEARLVLDGLQATLRVAGMTMDDLVQVQVFCPDLDLYGQFNEVYRGYFGKHLPARAFVGSGPLLRDARFEVLGVAVKR